MKSLWLYSGLLAGVSIVGGCQWNRSFLGMSALNRAEDPAYLLDPATESRQLAEVSSQTRDDLNAFTDQADALEREAGLTPDAQSTVSTAASYLASNTALASAQQPGLGVQQAVNNYPSATMSAGNQAYPSAPAYPVGTAPVAQTEIAPPNFGQSFPQQSKPAAPQAIAVDAALTQLRVRGVTPNAGPVRVAVFDSAAAFPNRNAASQKLTLAGSSAAVAAPLTSSGNAVAVAVYQDLNSDGKLNRSAFGIPTEPYGFSGRSTGSLGPPSFKEAAVQPGGTVEVLLTK